MIFSFTIKFFLPHNARPQSRFCTFRILVPFVHVLKQIVHCFLRGFSTFHGGLKILKAHKPIVILIKRLQELFRVFLALKDVGYI